jgi:hypothetical protein
VQWWKRIELAEVPWQPQEGYDGVETRFLGEGLEEGPPVMQVRFAPDHVEQPHWHGSDTLYVITAGEFVVGEEGSYRVGDIRWVRAGTFYGPEKAGPEGCEFILAAIARGQFDLSYDRATATRIGSLGDT